MAEINVYEQYFEAECTYNDAERKGALVMLISISEAGTIRFSRIAKRTTMPFPMTRILQRNCMRPRAGGPKKEKNCSWKASGSRWTNWRQNTADVSSGTARCETPAGVKKGKASEKERLQASPLCCQEWNSME